MRNQGFASHLTGIETGTHSVTSYSCSDPAQIVFVLYNMIYSQHQMVVTSDSMGGVSLINCQDGGWGELRVTEKWQAHNFEAWCVCFGCETHTILSGGDDCRLCMWDTRIQPKKPVTISKE